MAIQLIDTVEGNTYPSIQVTCERNGTLIDLTGCTVSLIICLNGVQTNEGHTGCTITNASQGIITYQQESTDFATAGTYYCDVHVTYPSGGSETLYDQLAVNVRKMTNSVS